MNITVYLGANEGNDPSLRKAVQELGTWIGASGNALVYGGSKTGLMGEIAKSVLDAGGNVTGVEPQFFMDEGFQYDGLTELIVTKDTLLGTESHPRHRRKQRAAQETAYQRSLTG